VANRGGLAGRRAELDLWQVLGLHYPVRGEPRWSKVSVMNGSERTVALTCRPVPPYEGHIRPFARLVRLEVPCCGILLVALGFGSEAKETRLSVRRR
jgi:hypothetical protein